MSLIARSAAAIAPATGPTAATAVAHRLDIALALLRLVAGTIFVAHGGQKLFVYGLAGVSGAFGQMGIPLPGIAGPAVAVLEFAGGLALIAGLLTRVTGAGLAVVMLGALTMVHLPAGFFLPNGIEFVLALAGIAGTLAIVGPGRYSLDAVIADRRNR